jgi:hypothetical protein
MNIPSTTTKINGKQVLLGIVLCSVIPLYILWPNSSTKDADVCMDSFVSFWNGEYPEPVVVIKGKKELQGYKNLCLSEKISCTPKEGIIHPWAQKDIQYVTKPTAVIYRSKVEFSSDLHDYKAGQEIFFEGRNGQGMCSFRVGEDRWLANCDDQKKLEHISGDPTQGGQQFFHAKCMEGYSSWIEVHQELFDDLSIVHGLIKGYGMVGVD